MFNYKINSKFIFFSLSIFMFSGCNSPKKDMEIKLRKIPVTIEKKIKLSDFVSRVDYSILPEKIGIARVDKAQIFDNHYFLADFDLTKSISVLDNDLQFLFEIKRNGEGPGEYSAILDFTVNKDNKTLDILSLDKLISYDFQGNFIKEHKLPGILSKIQHISKNNYLIYKAKSLHSDFIGPDDISILWNWNTETNEAIRIPSTAENIKLPFFTERNNLNFQDGKILFSANFLDTIYVYNTEIKLLEKRFFDSEKVYLPEEIRIKTKGRLNSDQLQKYFHQLPNLLENETHAITLLMYEGKFLNLIFNKKTNRSISFSKIENDIDQGYEFIIPVLLDNNIMISIIESQYLIEHFEKTGNSNVGPFYELVKNLTINSPLVMTKYHLK